MTILVHGHLGFFQMLKGTWRIPSIFRLRTCPRSKICTQIFILTSPRCWPHFLPDRLCFVSHCIIIWFCHVRLRISFPYLTVQNEQNWKENVMIKLSGYAFVLHIIQSITFFSILCVIVLRDALVLVYTCQLTKNEILQQWLYNLGQQIILTTVM